MREFSWNYVTLIELHKLHLQLFRLNNIVGQTDRQTDRNDISISCIILTRDETTSYVVTALKN